MKKQSWLAAVFCVLAVALPAGAQQKEGASARTFRSYKVEYTLVEMQDGKRLNARNYSVMVEEEERERGAIMGFANIRVGTRVPITTTNREGQATTTYMDVGLNIDCRIIPRGGDRVSIESTVEMNNFVSDPMTGGPPIMRSNKARGTAQLTFGKKMVVATYDDINSTRSTAVELTVTPQ